MDDPDQLPWMTESDYGAIADSRRATTGSYRNPNRAQGYLPKLSMIPTRMSRGGSPGDFPQSFWGWHQGYIGPQTSRRSDPKSEGLYGGGACRISQSISRFRGFKASNQES